MIPVFVLITCLTAGAANSGEPPSDLSSEARYHNRLGITHIEAGAHAAGVDELERAYLCMPDPLEYRAGRSKVLGSLRSALHHLYRSTGDPVHLHRLQAHLLRHLEALLIALGDTATTEDTAGSLAALRDVEETLTRRQAEVPAVAALAGPARAERPWPALPRPALPRPAPARPSPVAASDPPPSPLDARPALQRRAGSALLGVGFAGLGLMTYAVVTHADARRRLQALTLAVARSGAPYSALEDREAGDLFRRGHTRRTLGIISGVVGGVAIVTGVALHLVGRRRHTTTARVLPALAPGFARLDLHVRF